MSAPHSASVQVVLVSFNTRELTLRCLHSLTEEIARCSFPVGVWVVDNASTDNSAATVRARFPAVHVLEADQNLGFGRANNLAFEAVAREGIEGDFLLLNTDAFLHENTLQTLKNTLDAHSEAGVIAPRLHNEDGSLQRSVWPFPSPRGAWAEASGVLALGRTLRVVRDSANWPHDEEREIAWAIGACLLVRRAVYDQIGGFDPAFWMYGEETDWQKRIRDAGWTVVFTPRAVVTHLGGASGTSAGDTIREAFFQSGDRYLAKHFGSRGASSARFAAAFGHLLRLPIWTGARLIFPRRAHLRHKIRLARFLIRRPFTRLLP